MTTGPVVGPFDNLIIIGNATYTLSAQGGAFTNPPVSAGGDNRKVLSFTSSSAVTVTVPPGLTMGFYCDLIESGTGTVTVVAGSGVTIHSFSGSLAMAGRYATARLYSTDQDIYVLSGTGL
jgi:hypothetical protein